MPEMTDEQWVSLTVALGSAAVAWGLFHAAADPAGTRGGLVRRVLIRSRVLRTPWTLEEPARLRAFAAFPLAVALFAGLAQPPHDRILTSKVLYAGNGSEAELVNEIGPPARVTLLSSANMASTSPSCVGAARVLEYDIPTEGFPGRVRRALRMHPFRIVMVCVHASGGITGHTVVDVN
jgi:hypothetical protein